MLYTALFVGYVICVYETDYYYNYYYYYYYYYNYYDYYYYYYYDYYYYYYCPLYTSPSPRDRTSSRMPSSA